MFNSSLPIFPQVLDTAVCSLPKSIPFLHCILDRLVLIQSPLPGWQVHKEHLIPDKANAQHDYLGAEFWNWVRRLVGRGNKRHTLPSSRREEGQVLLAQACISTEAFRWHQHLKGKVEWPHWLKPMVYVSCSFHKNNWLKSCWFYSQNTSSLSFLSPLSLGSSQLPPLVCNVLQAAPPVVIPIPPVFLTKCVSVHVSPPSDSFMTFTALGRFMDPSPLLPPLAVHHSTTHNI